MPLPVNPTSSTEGSGRRRHWAYAAVGLVGAGMCAVFGLVLRAVLQSPGDDNPVGMIAAYAALLSLLPASGLLYFAVRARLRGHLLWWSASGLSTIVLAGPAVIALRMLLA